MDSESPVLQSLGGILPIMSLKDMMKEDRQKAETAQNAPMVQGLASHVRKNWEKAQRGKASVEQKMLSNVRARRGEYDPDTLARLRTQGSSEIFMMLTSVKCRAAASWLLDMVLGARDEKPWTLAPTPIAEMPDSDLEAVKAKATQTVAQMIASTGQVPPQDMVTDLVTQMRDQAMAQMQEKAKARVARMELRMEDQLVEGGFVSAMTDFIDDLTTFPSAILKGPVVRKRPKVRFDPDTGEMSYEDKLTLEWERVDPFMVYPSPDASSVNDGFLIERHRLSRNDLEAMIGVDGYDESAIRAVLVDYGSGGLHDWLSVDSAKANAEGRESTASWENSDELIDALQYWGSVQGQMLLDWGMEESEIKDPTKEYNVEVWLVGSWVIKATLNYHPEGKRGYYKASYEEIPSAFWGNSVADLCNDTQAMCNAAARALANNMGLASGPQVAVNVDRLPAGEDITQMYPWKIWQVTSDPMGNSGKPIEFFQPNSNVSELMAVFEKFSVLTDEYTGIPRYMTGDSPAGGAGRTASGMSMLMSNANKSIKRVIATIDTKVLKPLLERLYFYNMRYSEDPELKGDINIVARGAMGVALKEAAQVRRNEFLATVASNPIFSQIVGVDGMAALLREAAKTLDMNPDKVVPSPEKLKAQQMAAQAMAQLNPQQPQAQAPQTGPSPSGQNLANGAPQTDLFQPQR